MNRYSTREAAEKLGLHLVTVQNYIAAGKIPAPAVQRVGAGKFRVWTDHDIEKVRKVLPKIANGRKTRYQKKRSVTSSQESARPKKRTTKKK
jgi:excisionase family DNA binding protein